LGLSFVSDYYYGSVGGGRSSDAWGEASVASKRAFKMPDAMMQNDALRRARAVC
jgi:hypothetical protein